MNGNTKPIVKPFKFTLEVFISTVTDNKGINRKQLIDTTGFGHHCIDRCIAYLLSTSEIKRVFIRMSGPYKVYNYEVNDIN